MSINFAAIFRCSEHLLDWIHVVILEWLSYIISHHYLRYFNLTKLLLLLLLFAGIIGHGESTPLGNMMRILLSILKASLTFYCQHFCYRTKETSYPIARNSPYHIPAQHIWSYPVNSTPFLTLSPSEYHGEHSLLYSDSFLTQVLTTSQRTQKAYVQVRISIAII